MKNYEEWYKAYDIRSIFEEPVNGTFCYSLGKWIGKYLYELKWDEASFVFASDVREANNELIYWFLKWLEEWGCSNYVGIGVPVEAVDEEQQQLWWVASTMMLYWCTKDTFTLWAMFTASHNAPEYVGLKIVNEEALLLESDMLKWLVETYEEVPEDIDDEDFERIWEKAMWEDNPFGDVIEEKNYAISKVLSDRFSSLEKEYKIVVDFSNGAAVGYELIFLEELVAWWWHEIIYLNSLADSEFSAHLSDTTDPHDYEQLIHKVKEVGADFGIMFDGDADRLWVVDETWAIIGGDIVSWMISLNMLKRGGKRKKIIHDVFFTKAIIEAIEDEGGEPIKSRVWHRFVKELFKKEDALFGGELSAHLFFGEVGGFECPLLALYYLMDECSSHESLSQAVLPYIKYYKPALRKYEVSSQDEVTIILDKIQETYAEYTLDFTDGVGVYADDFWFVIRASNTEPVLKMVMEANSKAIWNDKIVWLELLITA
jgi:phosphomannomutase